MTSLTKILNLLAMTKSPSLMVLMLVKLLSLLINIIKDCSIMKLFFTNNLLHHYYLLRPTNLAWKRSLYSYTNFVHLIMSPLNSYQNSLARSTYKDSSFENEKLKIVCMDGHLLLSSSIHLLLFGISRPFQPRGIIN